MAKRAISGAQRLRNVQRKAGIVSRRQLRQFMRGEIEVLPCSMDTLDDMIAREFERLANAPAEREG